MEPTERDTEIFERIPWESLERPSGARWWVYLAAGAAVLVALGFTAGERLGTAAPAPEAAPVTAPPPSVVVPTVPVVTTVTAPSTTFGLTEADLLAGSDEAAVVAAAGTAEWYVAGYFSLDDETGRSFVEDARAVRFEWTDADTARVTVAIRRLAATEDEGYRRVPAEMWEVAVRLGDDGWVVESIPAPSSSTPPAEPDVSGGEEWTDEAGLVWEVAAAP